MKINVSAIGEILIDDKVQTDEEVSVIVETLNRARGDAKEIQKLSKTIETLRKEYNGSGKETA
jgi:hypothetical protein